MEILIMLFPILVPIYLLLSMIYLIWYEHTEPKRMKKWVSELKKLIEEVHKGE